MHRALICAAVLSVAAAHAAEGSATTTTSFWNKVSTQVVGSQSVHSWQGTTPAQVVGIKAALRDWSGRAVATSPGSTNGIRLNVAVDEIPGCDGSFVALPQVCLAGSDGYGVVDVVCSNSARFNQTSINSSTHTTGSDVDRLWDTVVDAWRQQIPVKVTVTEWPAGVTRSPRCALEAIELTRPPKMKVLSVEEVAVEPAIEPIGN